MTDLAEVRTFIKVVVLFLYVIGIAVLVVFAFVTVVFVSVAFECGRLPLAFAVTTPGNLVKVVGSLV